MSTIGCAAPPAITMSAAVTPTPDPSPPRKESVEGSGVGGIETLCGTRNRASDSGSATVAESPIARSCGASRHSRASPSDSRSPRLEVTSACSSSSTMRFSDANSNGASSDDSSSASCSGVVSRMSGGYLRCRARRDTGVSPVRVSTRIGSFICAIGVSRLRAMSTASAFSGEM